MTSTEDQDPDLFALHQPAAALQSVIFAVVRSLRLGGYESVGNARLLAIVASASQRTFRATAEAVEAAAAAARRGASTSERTERPFLVPALCALNYVRVRQLAVRALDELGAAGRDPLGSLRTSDSAGRSPITDPQGLRPTSPPVSSKPAGDESARGPTGSPALPRSDAGAMEFEGLPLPPLGDVADSDRRRTPPPAVHVDPVVLAIERTMAALDADTRRAALHPRSPVIPNPTAGTLAGLWPTLLAAAAEEARALQSVLTHHFRHYRQSPVLPDSCDGRIP